MPFYLIPEQDDFNQELQVCIAETLYDIGSIVADPGAYTKEELANLHSQIVSKSNTVGMRTYRIFYSSISRLSSHAGNSRYVSLVRRIPRRVATRLRTSACST